MIHIKMTLGNLEKIQTNIDALQRAIDSAPNADQLLLMDVKFIMEAIQKKTKLLKGVHDLDLNIEPRQSVPPGYPDPARPGRKVRYCTDCFYSELCKTQPMSGPAQGCNPSDKNLWRPKETASPVFQRPKLELKDTEGCKHSDFFSSLGAFQTNREYWFYTEMFVYLHNGKDYCDCNEELKNET